MVDSNLDMNFLIRVEAIGREIHCLADGIGPLWDSMKVHAATNDRETFRKEYLKLIRLKAILS